MCVMTFHDLPSFDWLVVWAFNWFVVYGISALVGYLMPNLFLYK